MAYTGFRLTGRRAVSVRPDDKDQVVIGDVWARDSTSASVRDGTEIDATFVNRIKANLEAAVAWLRGGSLAADGDDQIKNALTTKFGQYLPLAGGTMSQPIVLPGDPVLGLQAATKQYVDSLAAGLKIKPSAKAATTANITLSGTQTVDTVALSAGDICLVRAQTTASQNGLYTVASGSWTRHDRMDTWAEVPGALIVVEQGGTLGDSIWLSTADTGGTLGTTTIAFSQFPLGSYQASSALLTAIAALSMVADRYVYGTGSNAVALGTLTSFMRTVLDDADAAAARGTLAAEPQGELFAINAQSGTSYTLVLADKGKRVSGSNGSATTFTVPPNSSVAFPVNSRIEVFQVGAGQISIAAGAGVTIQSSGSKLKLTGQYSAAILTKTATDTWDLVGDIAS